MKTNFTLKIFLLTNVLAISLLFFGCPSKPPKLEKVEPAKPEIIFKIASLDLSNLNKRIEKKDISNLEKAIKNEQIDILAIQAVIRYPGLATRTDIINELSKRSDWNHVFGEMINVAGQQKGNVIFSTYPIISHNNKNFESIKTNNFESALHTTIDLGVKSISLICTHLPPKANLEDQSECIKEIVASLEPSKQLAIITGNLPSTEKTNYSKAFAEINRSNEIKSLPVIWYSNNERLKLFNPKIKETNLGNLVIVEVGLFK